MTRKRLFDLALLLPLVPLFATAVAYAYLVAEGFKVTTTPEQVRDLARLVRDHADLARIAAELRTWTA